MVSSRKGTLFVDPGVQLPSAWSGNRWAQMMEGALAERVWTSPYWLWVVENQDNLLSEEAGLN